MRSGVPWDAVMELDLEQFNDVAEKVAYLNGIREAQRFDLAVTAAQGSAKSIKSVQDDLGKRTKKRPGAGRKGKSAPVKSNLDEWLAGGDKVGI